MGMNWKTRRTKGEYDSPHMEPAEDCLAEPRKESLETFPSVQATMATGKSGVSLHLKNTTQRARP